MAELSWAEDEAAESFAGGVTAIVGLSAARPACAERLRLAAVAKLDDEGRELLVALAAQIKQDD